MGNIVISTDVEILIKCSKLIHGQKTPKLEVKGNSLKVIKSTYENPVADSTLNSTKV